MKVVAGEAGKTGCASAGGYKLSMTERAADMEGVKGLAMEGCCISSSGDVAVGVVDFLVIDGCMG